MDIISYLPELSLSTTWITGMVMALAHIVVVRKMGPHGNSDYVEGSSEYWLDGLYIFFWPVYVWMITLYGSRFRQIDSVTDRE